MGWVGDTFKALFGLDDEHQRFRESLTSAERHLDWSVRGGDPGDLKTALRLLGDCLPDDAPNAHYAYRRWRVAAEAHSALARRALLGMRSRADAVLEEVGKLQDGRRALATQIEALRARVSALESEGSLISAREERHRLEELERDAREYPDIDGEAAAQRGEALSEFSPLFEQHRKGAEAALEALGSVTRLSAEDAKTVNGFRSRTQEEIAALDAEWKGLAADLERAARGAASASPQAGKSS